MTSYYNLRFFWYRNIGIGVVSLLVGYLLAILAYGFFNTSLVLSQLFLIAGYTWAIIALTYTAIRMVMNVLGLTTDHVVGLTIMVVVCIIEMIWLDLIRGSFFELYSSVVYAFLLLFYSSTVDKAKPPLAQFVVVQVGDDYTGLTTWYPHEVSEFYQYVTKKAGKRIKFQIKSPLNHSITLEEALFSLGCTFRYDRNGISVWEREGKVVASYY